MSDKFLGGREQSQNDLSSIGLILRQLYPTSIDLPYIDVPNSSFAHIYYNYPFLIYFYILKVHPSFVKDTLKAFYDFKNKQQNCMKLCFFYM